MQNRLLKLKRELTKHHLDALLVTSIPNIIYLTACPPDWRGFSNFLSERETFLLITKNKQFIFTNSLYIEEIKEMNLGFEIVQITRENPFGKIVLKQLAEKLKLKTLGFESKNLTVEEYIDIKKSTLRLCTIELDSIRLVKDQNEIQNIQKACKVGDGAFEHILKKIKTGITEKELAFELELFVKKQGFDLSFPSIVAFGPHSSVPHHQPGNQKLKRDSIVLLDFGVKVNNYCSDMTRTVFFGKASAEQKKMYNTVFEAQRKSFDLLNTYYLPTGRQGLIHNTKNRTINAKKIDQAARSYIESQGYPSIPHSLGHGIGLEVHESPRLSPVSKDILEPGMVFSIEPGIYISGFGGVRIEDLVAIEQNGPRFLTHAPKHPDLTPLSLQNI